MWPHRGATKHKRWTNYKSPNTKHLNSTKLNESRNLKNFWKWFQANRWKSSFYTAPRLWIFGSNYSSHQVERLLYLWTKRTGLKYRAWPHTHTHTKPGSYSNHVMFLWPAGRDVFPPPGSWWPPLICSRPASAAVSFSLLGWTNTAAPFQPSTSHKQPRPSVSTSTLNKHS